jgi:hypothetical protein
MLAFHPRDPDSIYGDKTAVKHVSTEFLGMLLPIIIPCSTLTVSQRADVLDQAGQYQQST